MKYIHQDCLEQWLKLSNKKHCDICNHLFVFELLYDDAAPKSLSFSRACSIVFSKLFSILLFYCRIALAILVWVLWVPFVSIWTWRLFLHPDSLFATSQQQLPSQSFAIATLLRSWLGLSQDHTSYFLMSIDYLESLADWPFLLKAFFSDVFEGQMIISMLIILAVLLLIIREAVIGLIDDPLIPMDPLQDFVDNPNFPPPNPEALLNQLDGNIPNNQVIPPNPVPALDVPQNDLPNAQLQNVEDMNETPLQNADNNRMREGLANVQESTNQLQNSDNLDVKSPKESTSTKPVDKNQLNDLHSNSSSSSGLNTPKIISGLATPQFNTSRISSVSSGLEVENPDSISSDENKPFDSSIKRLESEVESNSAFQHNSQHQNSQNSENRLFSKQEPSLSTQPQSTIGINQTNQPNKAPHEQLKRLHSIPYTTSAITVEESSNLTGLGSKPLTRSKESMLARTALVDEESSLISNSLDIKGKSKAENPAMDVTKEKGKQPIHSLKHEHATKSSELEKSSQPDSQTDEEFTFKNLVHAMRTTHANPESSNYKVDLEKLENDLLALESSFENTTNQPPAQAAHEDTNIENVDTHEYGQEYVHDSDGFDDIDENEENQPLLNQPQMNQPLVNQPEGENIVDPNAAQINIGVNVGINDGEIVAQIELNDVNALMDLVGINGPVWKLFQHALLIHLLVFVLLGTGIWMPYIVGTLTSHVLQSMVIPAIEHGFEYAIWVLQTVSDPVVEPIADAILVFTHSVGLNFTQININTTNSTESMDLLTPLLDVFRNETETVVTEHANFIQSLQEVLSGVILGYIMVFSIVLVYMSLAGMGNHPYMLSLGRLFNTITMNFMSGLKMVMFISLELLAFPLFCGLLLDVCTVPAFSDTITFQTRYALYQSHPWMFCFVHWIVGSTIMFQFASYVGIVRETVRPGVLWFVRDPNDPQFNAMREILKRTILTQFRKLFIGILLYGTVVMSIFGGSVMLIKLWDWGVITFIGTKSIFQVLPLRLEYHDTITELPFDLFFFQFVFPILLRRLNPKIHFRNFIGDWFRIVSSKLRLSSFMLSGSFPEEETDDEDEIEIRHLTIDPEKEDRMQQSIVHDDGTTTPLDEHEQDDWEDEDVDDVVEALFDKPGFTQVKRTRGRRGRKMRYLRVPNHDTVEIIPGDRMLVWMEEDAEIFGRPNETPEQVKRNWTKVYAPANYKLRLVVLVVFQLISFATIIPMLTALPLVVGRVILYFFEKWTVYEITLPKHSTYTNPIRSSRIELPTHDLYCHLTGVVFLFMMMMIIKTIWNYFSVTLQRRNAFRRTPRNSTTDTPIPPQSLGDKIIDWWVRKGNVIVKKYVKIFYLIIVVGIIIPTCLGTLLSFYFLTPFHSMFNSKPIIYILVDWSTGAIVTRILYHIVELFPQAEISRIWLQTINGPAAQIDIRTLNDKIFGPFITFSIIFLTLPTVSTLFEILIGVPPTTFSTIILNYTAIFLFSFGLGLYTLIVLTRSIIYWLTHLRDDQYLIGRRLHNVVPEDNVE
ncbi:hypothetical protein BC833DRAFT_577813 [Globomyces pollinis-pini]|nr:hypothetical protein BC833DRAFT_577813 [Globomyces pollinis-pini]